MAIDNKKIFQTKKPGGVSKAKTFAEKFAEERIKQGAGGTFMFKGKKYSTNRADDKKKKVSTDKNKSNTTKKFVKKTGSTPTIFKKKKDDPISKITVKSQATKEEIDARTKQKKPKFGDESLITKNNDMSKTKVIDTKSNKKNLLQRIRNKKSGGKIKYNKGGGDLFVSRAYGGKIGN
jgi:hypothetical protein